MAGLPSIAIYVVLGLFAVLENAIPPLPTDAAVAVGAFLSHRGVTTPLGVFLVIWICNMAGATLVYFVSRRYGRQLFATRLGRRLIAPRALVTIEREYLRFGVVGIFIARFLPGFRAVVAPFAGLASVSAARALIPMGLASALWYGALTLAGTALGAEWSSISHVITRMNRTLAIGALVAAIALAIWWLIRRRHRARRPLWAAVGTAFDSAGEISPLGPHEARRAAAVLLLEIAYADSVVSDAEREAVSRLLGLRWNLPARRRPLSATHPHPERSWLVSYRERIEERFGPERRIALLEHMWAVALEEGTELADSTVAARAAALLGVTDDELRAVRDRAGGAGGAAS